MTTTRKVCQLVDVFKVQASLMIFGHPHSTSLVDEEYVKDFGATPFILAKLWMLLVYEGLPQMSCPLHLLWWLYLVRNYPTKRVFQRLIKLCGLTYRKYLDPIKTAMMKVQRHVVSQSIGCLLFYLAHIISFVMLHSSSLTMNLFCARYQISYKNNSKRVRTCGRTHDGTDFVCQNKPNTILVRKAEWGNLPFDPNYYSHKFKRSGLRYGISVDIKTGLMVGAHGPKPCGKWPDLKIFKKYVLPHLEPGKQVETDRGYRHPRCRNPEDYLSKSEYVAKSRAASRHEAVNGRLKNWRSLKQVFRHDHHEHKYFFFTAAVVDNLMYKKYGPVFDVSY
jgi:hypothetical protein